MGFDCSELLCCPKCGASFKDALDTTFLLCTGCNQRYDIVNGVPRFVDGESYAASFGFEWNIHRQTQLDSPSSIESEHTLQQKTGLAADDVRGKLVLDVGCGMGRFADVISRWGGKVIGIDLSSAVDAAYENIGQRPNVNILQADVFQLPFRENSFDIIYSIGVLHHTPDCEKAFRSLPKFLKPGGKIVIWLYDRNIVWGRIPQLYWRFTRKMNPQVLHSLCKLAIPLYFVVRLPFIGKFLWRVFPIDTNPDPQWRVLDTFDWYSARYRSWHTVKQVQSWFEQESLTDIQSLEVPVSVRGKKQPANRETQGQ